MQDQTDSGQPSLFPDWPPPELDVVRPQTESAPAPGPPPATGSPLVDVPDPAESDPRPDRSDSNPKPSRRPRKPKALPDDDERRDGITLFEAWHLLLENQHDRALPLFKNAFRNTRSVEAYVGTLACSWRLQSPTQVLDWAEQNMQRVRAAQDVNEDRLLLEAFKIVIQCIGLLSEGTRTVGDLRTIQVRFVRWYEDRRYVADKAVTVSDDFEALLRALRRQISNQASRRRRRIQRSAGTPKIEPSPEVLHQYAWRLHDERAFEKAFELFQRVFEQTRSMSAFAGSVSCLAAMNQHLALLDWFFAGIGRVRRAANPEEETLGRRVLEVFQQARRAAKRDDYIVSMSRDSKLLLTRFIAKCRFVPSDETNLHPAGQAPRHARAADPRAQNGKPGQSSIRGGPLPTVNKVAEAREAELSLDLPRITSELVFRFEPPTLLRRLGEELPASLGRSSVALAEEQMEDWRLALLAQRLSLTASFDELLCLESVRGVEMLHYQVETARRVLRQHRGRALLADEVGLGKTIEASLVLKEYLLRGLIRRFLVLCPPSLISQWQSELRDKFLVDSIGTDDELYRSDPARFWASPGGIVASMHTAKIAKNADILRDLELDLVVVDEAHHLKNRSTVAWKFVNGLRPMFLLLLTATPVQNDLAELYNLITLLRPGTLGTPAHFRERFIANGKRNIPKDPEALRELMGSVMIRNTRALSGLKLPPRRAVTYHVTQPPAAAHLYSRLTSLLRELYPSAAPKHKLVLLSLMARAGSSLVALASSLERFSESDWLDAARANTARELHRGATALAGQEAKLQRLVLLLRDGPGKKLVFTQFRDTQEFLASALRSAGHTVAVFHGGLSVAERDAAVEAFRQQTEVLLCTEAGSEGQNLQFARTVVNYDLPWNPMRIEQRIGRVHRIGQTEPVYVFNLALSGSIESRMLNVLEQKINLFELVVGELGVILGDLTEDQDFPDRVLEIWLGSRSDEEVEAGFARLGEDLAAARDRHEASARLDAELFGRDFEA